MPRTHIAEKKLLLVTTLLRGKFFKINFEDKDRGTLTVQKEEKFQQMCAAEKQMAQLA